MKQLIEKDEQQEVILAELKQEITMLKEDNASHKKDFEIKGIELKRLNNILERIEKKLDGLILNRSAESR